MGEFFMILEKDPQQEDFLQGRMINSINSTSGLKLRVRTKNLIFLFLSQNICCGYSKEPSQ